MVKKVQTLIRYLKSNYPDVYEEYKNFKRKDSLPPIGTEVETIRWGFGGPPGQILEVVKYGYAKDGRYAQDYIVLKSYKGDFLSNMDSWYKDFIICKGR